MKSPCSIALICLVAVLAAVELGAVDARADNSAQERTAQEKAAQEKAVQEKAVQEKAAQEKAVQQEAAQALLAVKEALRDPKPTLEVLRGCAQVANWKGEYDLAIDCWQRILARPGVDREARREASLGIARSTSWAGDGDSAAELYEEHLSIFPDHREARLEWAQAEVWRGDTAAALDVLDGYRARYGADQDHDRELAFALAGTKPRASLHLLRQLIDKKPDDVFLRGIEPVALAARGRPEQALESSRQLQQLAPDAPRTADVRRSVETPLRSEVMPVFELYGDSDDVSRQRAGFEVHWFLDPKWRIDLGFARSQLDGRLGSGLEATGGRALDSESLWLGIDARLSSGIRLSARGGETKLLEPILGKDELFTYQLGLEIALGDDVDLRLGADRRYYDVSARALDLGLHARTGEVELEARLGRRFLLAGRGSWSELSDDNRRVDLMLAPRRQALRRQRFNLDLGLRARWLSFDRRAFGSGYYAPLDYRRYDLVAYAYWKLGDDHGLSWLTAVGGARDETMRDYELAYDLSLDLRLGIFSDWMLRLQGAYTNNDRVASGAFDAHSGRFILHHRF